MTPDGGLVGGDEDSEEECNTAATKLNVVWHFTGPTPEDLK
jgi:hypothetical protein